MTPDARPPEESQPDTPLPDADPKPERKGLTSPRVIEPPEDKSASRSDWKMMLLAGFVFLLLTIGIGLTVGSSRNTDFEHAATVPLIATIICFLYGLWKLMRLTDRTSTEEKLLGFFTILLLSPILFQTFFIPFALVVAFRRETSRPSAKGKFAAGAALGCGGMMMLGMLGLAILCGAFR
jgi:hypothetical protein